MSKPVTDLNDVSKSITEARRHPIVIKFPLIYQIIEKRKSADEDIAYGFEVFFIAARQITGQCQLCFI